MSGSSTEAMGNGFFNHGVATPISNHRGTAVTVDGAGRNVVLIWLYDNRGGYALLMIDAETGNSEEFPMPYPPGGDGPFAAILSSRNRYYTHFNSHFVEFDPEKRAFTFHHKTVPQMAMSMTEDDDGRIWSGTYPNSAVASYNPHTGEFRDYGNLYDQNWRQYPRAIAADDTGWIYFGAGQHGQPDYLPGPGNRQSGTSSGRRRTNPGPRPCVPRPEREGLRSYKRRFRGWMDGTVPRCANGCRQD